jgi:hypothetical protein
MVGFIIRSIPNLLTAHPVGYDTIDYATQLYDWKNMLQDPNIIFQTPLFILQSDFLFILSNLEPFIILRVLQPVIYGFLVASFYYVCKVLYNWNSKWVFFGTLLFSVQTVALRISWDLLKNELGLVLLLITLTRLKKPRTFSFVLLTILIVLSHQIISFMLLGIIFFLVMGYYIRNDYVRIKNLLLSSIPFFIFVALLFFFHIGLINLNNEIDRSIFLPIITSIPIVKSLPFPFINYMIGEGLTNYQQSYFFLLVDVFSLYVASFLLILPFMIYELVVVRKKTFRNLLNPINIWTILCSVPILNVILFPIFALFSWHRWMFMLIVPYSIYATIGIMNLSTKFRSNSLRKYFHISILIILFIASLLYSLMPHTNSLSLYSTFNPASKYSPTTMMRNTVSLHDVPNLPTVVTWADHNLDSKSCLLVKDAFVDWVKILSSTNLTVFNYKNQDVLAGFNYVRNLNYNDIFWLWWDNGIGLQWYGQIIPSYFVPVYQSGSLVIYKYIL